MVTLMIFGNITIKSQDTIPNGNFENWNTNTSPANWSTVNNLLPLGFFACNQTTNSYEGTYALSMKTIDLDGMLVPAVATLGIVGMGFTEGGVPFTGKPESLKGYFKHPSSGDAVMLAVQFYNQGNQIGGGSWSTSDSIGEFTMFEVPINFTSVLMPDTMNITILTDQNVLGSNMIVDALHFEYPPVKVEEAYYNSIKVYPNPCHDFIFIKNEEKINSIKVMNIAGTVFIHEDIYTNQPGIDLSNLPEGLYILEIGAGGKVYHQKIIKK